MEIETYNKRKGEKKREGESAEWSQNKQNKIGKKKKLNDKEEFNGTHEEEEWFEEDGNEEEYDDLEGNPFGESNAKYWLQRYTLFSRFDEGIELDEGGGGNAIQFAFTCERVISIDNNPERLRYARRNAEIYGVADRIEFILGDYMKLIPQLKADVVFLSPPWGGPGYIDWKYFDLHRMPINGFKIFEETLKITPNIAYLLPRNVSKKQLLRLAGPGGICEMEENLLDGKVKTVTAYFGELIVDPEKNSRRK